MIDNSVKMQVHCDRNNSIDILKFICAILVVFLHCQWKYNALLLPLTRSAVPCFYMISGFLLLKDGGIGTERLMRNLKKILKITIIATLLFFVWDELISIFSTRTIFIPTFREIIVWIIFNDCPFGIHLWYLYAYIYVLLIVALFEKQRKLNYLFFSVPFLLLADVLLGKYGMLLFGIDVPVQYLRNFLFVALPYFCLGMLLKKYQKQFNLSKIVLLGGVILGVLTSYIERDILTMLNAVTSRDHYLSTTFLSINLFLLVTSFSVSYENLITKIGKNDSLYIYILHPIILGVCGIIILRTGLTRPFSYVAPIICIFFTMLTIKVLKFINIIK